MSDSLQPCELQQARLLCPPLSPVVCSNSYPLSQGWYLTISCSALCLLLPSIVSSILVVSNELALCIRWAKCWRISFSISPPNEYSELISFSTDWFDLLAVQETLKSLLQHHSSKACSLALSLLYGPTLHPYMTIGKTLALTIQTSVSKVLSLLFNMLSRLVIAFLPRSKYLLI